MRKEEVKIRNASGGRWTMIHMLLDIDGIREGQFLMRQKWRYTTCH
jgi:hypothetical protein